MTTTVSGSDAEASPPSLESVVAEYYDDGLRLAWLLLGDRDQAEDAVGEVLARTWRRSRGHTIDNPRAYLRQAIVNESNNRIRGLIRERRVRQRHRGDHRGARHADEHVAEADELATALRQLPPRQRTALVLYFYEDLPQEEIARAMGCAVGTVKSNVARGLQALRDQLQEVG